MNTWEKYTPAYEATLGRQYYDLQLKNTRELYHCWPYAGHFTPVNGTGEGYMESWRVESIRVSAIQ